MQEERKSNFELLRIFSIIGVIGSHFLGHGGALTNLYPTQINFYFANFLESFFNVAVNCFVLISGYFSIKLRPKRLLELELQILFYSLIIVVIFWILGINNFTIKELIVSFMPVLLKRWWFITTYIALVLISPFLNIFINSITHNQFKKLLMTLFLLFSVYPTIFKGSLDDSLGFGIINFIFLYFIGAYIKKYNFDCSVKKSSFFFLTSTLLMFLATIVLSLKSGSLDSRFYSYNNIFILIQASSLFLLFKNFNFYSKKINSISSLVFGIYLIDDHIYIRNYIYKNIFNTQNYFYSNYFILHSLLCIIIIFVACLVIEYLRSLLFKLFIPYIFNHKIVTYFKNNFSNNIIKN